MTWTADKVRDELAGSRGTYEAKLRDGQPEGWTPDGRTLDLWCLGQWLMEVLPELDRRERLWYFNRKARAEFDLFALAARVVNGELSGDP